MDEEDFQAGQPMTYTSKCFFYFKAFLSDARRTCAARRAARVAVLKGDGEGRGERGEGRGRVHLRGAEDS